MSEVPPQSNYYRPPPPSGPLQPIAPELGFEDISVAWKIISSNLAMWAVVTLLYFCTAGALSMILGVVAQRLAYGDSVPKAVFTLSDFLHVQLVSLPFNIVGGAFGYVMLGGIQLAALNVLRGRELDLGDVFKGFRHFGPLFIFGLIYTVASYIAAALCFFPVIYVVGAFSVAPLMIMEQGMDGFGATSHSIRTLGNKAWLAGLILLVAGVLGALGVCALCVGALITLPIYFIVPAVFYHRLFPPAQPQREPDPIFSLDV